MQEFISTVSVLLGVLIFLVAVVAFFKPLPEVWLGTKRNAALAVILSVTSCSVGASLAPPTETAPPKPQAVVESAVEAKAEAPPAEALTALPPARPYPSQTDAPPQKVARFVEKSIALWDALESCRRRSDFRQLGTMDGGPCGNWTYVIKEMTNSGMDAEIVQHGFDCTAEAVWSAGISHVVLETNAFSAGPEQRQGAGETIVTVRKKVEACRAKLKPHLPQAAISKAELGAAWPLTVSAGKVGCDYNGAAWFQAAGGARRYALNSDAYDRYPKIEPIWAKTGEGARRDIGPLVEKAERFCTYG